ncbi:MAG: sulfatase-like hydrolase/transferase [Kiritimatiellae bacterium]|nr:sulfatase-like hydrolase/transferase [Kiritimatiellia bacterium]
MNRNHLTYLVMAVFSVQTLQRKLTRFMFVCLLTHGLLLSQQSRAEAVSKERINKALKEHPPYNIILIVTDQERYFEDFPEGTDFSGRKRLKAAGTSFEKHYTCANMCTSSRSVMYTGQHIPHTGMFDNTGLPWQTDLSTNITTVGDLMREAGYYTAYKGKAHLNSTFEDGKSDLLQTDAMEAYGFSDYNATGDDFGHEHGGYTYDIPYTAGALSWLRTTGANLNATNQPWFLAVNMINPHDIMYFNTDLPGVSEQGSNSVHQIERKPHYSLYNRTYTDKLPLNLFQAITEKGRPPAHEEYTRGWNMLFGKIPERESNWRRYRDYYYNCLHDVDDQIVKLLDTLDALGLTTNTIIIFTADHGEMAGSHGLRGKGPFAYEENIHLPFYLVHPDYPGGRKCQAITSHLDLTPTIVDLSGVNSNGYARLTKGLNGHSLKPLLAAPEKASLDAIRPGALFCFNMFLTIDSDYIAAGMKVSDAGEKDASQKNNRPKPDLTKRGALRTVCDGRYKFTRYFSPRQHNLPQTMDELYAYNDVELFDLQKDPDEMHNLAMDRTKNGALILAMNKKLNNLISAEIGEDIGQELPQGDHPSWYVTSEQTRH